MDGLQLARVKISNALAQLAPLFNDGAKLSFIMRHPRGGANCYLIVTDDELLELEAVVRLERGKHDDQREPEPIARLVAAARELLGFFADKGSCDVCGRRINDAGECHTPGTLCDELAAALDAVDVERLRVANGQEPRR